MSWSATCSCDSSAWRSARLCLDDPVGGEQSPDEQIAIGAGKNPLLGPFPHNTHNDVDGKVALSWSDGTDIEVALATP